MSDSLPGPDEEFVVRLPEEASLDDLFAGWKRPGRQQALPSLRQSRPIRSRKTPPPPSQRLERRGAERREPHEFKVELRLTVAGMSLMPSLCAALERAGGERHVMRAGERPHVLAGERRHDVASAILSVNAVDRTDFLSRRTPGVDDEWIGE